MFHYYPLVDEDDFQTKLLMHSEFNELVQHTIQSDYLSNKDKMMIIKARMLNTNLTPKPYQEFVSRFISSYTPYSSLLLFHSPGSGKTLSLLQIIRTNMDYIVNQQSCVTIVVPRRILKQQWMNEISNFIPEMAGFVRITTYKSLYNRVIGEKHIVVDENTFKTKREHSAINVSFEEYKNGILVLEEAHNVTNNNYTLAIMRIRDNVESLKIIALTATPIKNTIDEIVDIFNFLLAGRRLDKNDYFSYIDGRPIIKDADKLKRDITGYVSTVNINDSSYLSKKMEVGEHVDGLRLVKICVVKCPPVYERIITGVLARKRDSLGKIHESISNIILPYVFDDTKFIPVYGNAGLAMVMQAVKENRRRFNSSLASILGVMEQNMFTILDNGRLSGKFFTAAYIKHFSPKMYFVFKLLGKLRGNVFVYSAFKSVGIDLFSEMLINEGYSDFMDPGRGIESMKLCYVCNQTKANHTSLSHEWHPLSFFVCSSDDPNMINTITLFNASNNIDGRFIKIIMASQMINEGVNLKNVVHVIKMDAPLTMARNEQIERRAIRLNSHNDYILRNGVIPDVYVYNIALRTNAGVSVEISNYLIAERKFVEIKKIYEILHQASIDVGVYEAKSAYQGESIHTTRSLVEKNKRIDTVIKYVTNVFSNVRIVLYSDLLAELRPKFNDISVMIAIKYLVDIEKVFLVSMNEKLYLFSNIIQFSEQVNENMMNIHNFFDVRKDQKGEEYYYDMDYLSSRSTNDVCGIVTSKFKLKFSNTFIDDIGLDIVKSKGTVAMMRGWICMQSINRENMRKVCDYFDIDYENNKVSCDAIFKKLFDMEKYTTDNTQYLIYPRNYPSIPSPLNIYDRFKTTSVQFESQGYKIEDVEKLKIGGKVKLGNRAFDKVVFKFKCIRSNEAIITITID